ncbi:MAG: 2,4-dihydroxyhept-2-ene-1,7-dioic acid aldolase [Chloroflexi bacterium]|jgi:2-keto-3-deoxy-L-rhamnonate aldolase RhmA|nr:2,4-dihydroxyhept-2-ene-1,7-dioic acid aldolase [Chloroflexota bacterium]
MNHQFRSRLLGGELLVGTMVSQASAEIAEILASVGFDWLFVDAEHSPMSRAGMQRVLQGAGPATPCLVRISASEETSIRDALDIGAAGIIAPRVNSAEHAAQVVRFAKYAPIGNRGVGVARALGYGLRVEEYLNKANEETAVVLQAEHIEAVENIEEIVQVAGVDAVFVGPYDLSASLDRLGEVEHPQVMAAVDQVAQVCRQANIPLGAFGVSAAAVEPYIERGYRLIVAGIDMMMLGFAAKELLSQIKT